MDIRPARPADFERLQEIERRAGELFRSVGLDAIADDDPFSLEELAAADVLVAVVDGGVVAYALTMVLDGTTHVEQLSVDPAFGGQGIGRRLLDHLGHPLTLTTFRDVIWNAPFYQKLGFLMLDDALAGERVRQVLRREVEHGMPASRRCAMRLVLNQE